jgi:hypothetical protein
LKPEFVLLYKPAGLSQFHHASPGMDAMKIRIAALTSFFGSSFFSGLSAGTLVVQIAATWIMTCGSSSVSLASGLLAAAFGIGFARIFQGKRRGTWSGGLLTAVLIAISWGLSFGLNNLLRTSVHLIGDSVAWIAFALPSLLVAVNVALLLVWYSSDRNEDNGRISQSFGVAFGLLVPMAAGIFIAPVAVFVSTLLLITFTWRTLASYRTQEEQQRSEVERWSVGQTIAVAAAALAVHAGIRIASVQMPMSFAIAITAACIALSILACFSLTFLKRYLSLRLVAVPLIVLCLVPLLFNRFVDLNLSLNATFSNVALLTLIRALQLSSIWIAAVLAFRCNTQQTAQPQAWQLAVGFAVLSGSILLAAMGLSPTMQLMLSVLMFALPVLLTATSRRARMVTLSTVALGSLILFAVPMDGASAVHLLFNARSAQGYRMGLKREIIEQSHCTRLLEQHNCDGDHLSVWRSAGDQILIRRNGFPVGQVTSNAMTTPQPVPETLTTLLPLFMHRRAQSVMLLGDDSGAGVQLCTHFPVHTIEAIRPDDVMTDIAERFTWVAEASGPDHDDRVTVRHVDVSIAVRTKRAAQDLFDVVVAASPNPISLRCQDQLTAEFYTAVRSQLNEEGVFCQRIVQHDLGSEPLVRIVSSIRSVFGRVVVTQMAAGQLAIVASVNPQGLLDEGLLGRLRREHVTQELTRSGWDWSQVAALPVVDTNDPVGIFEHQPMLAASSAGNAHFVISLPLEATRWGNKAAELQQTFAPHQQTMADAAPRSSAYMEYSRRMSAVVQQKEILTSFPDNPWPYRNSLKMEMQRNPGPTVESVRDGKVVRRGDALDEYRKDYFTNLGQMLTQAAGGLADPMSLRTFEQFTRKYEPLLSYFARHELLRVHEATGHPSPALELRHRLHTVYFSDGGDFSIRLINKAITQLLDDPELLASDDSRYDHVNSLLQELVRRWEVRVGYSPPSAIRTQQEVDECVSIANRALDAMEEWAGPLEIADSDLTSRRRFINQALISPLRTYREQVLSHRLNHAMPNDADSQVAGPDELPMLADPSELLTN